MTPDERARRYVEAAISNELNEAARASKGTGNSTLFEVACAVGQMVGAGWIGETEAEAKLMQAGQDHASRDGDKKAIETIKNGLRRGKTAPRELPEDLAGASLDGLPAATVSPEILKEMREKARAREVEAEWHRDQARKHLAEADYCQRMARALWDHAEALEDLRRRGIDDEAAQHFSLGFDMWPVPVTSREYHHTGTVPSLVIPWRRKDKLVTVQYRHLAPCNGKYHWHDDMGGGRLFNGDAILEPKEDYVLVVEGALNAATLWSKGLKSVVALPSVSGWKKSFARFFQPFDVVVFLPDAGGAAAWVKHARDVPGARVALLPADPDEYLISVGGSAEALWRALRYAEVVD